MGIRMLLVKLLALQHTKRQPCRAGSVPKVLAAQRARAAANMLHTDGGRINGAWTISRSRHLQLK